MSLNTLFSSDAHILSSTRLNFLDDYILYIIYLYIHIIHRRLVQNTGILSTVRDLSKALLYRGSSTVMLRRIFMRRVQPF